MGFNDVVISQGEEPYFLTKTVLKNLNLDLNQLKNKKILIKPNAGRLVGPHLGINTNPEVVAGVIDFFLEAGIKNLSIGESPILGVKTLEALEKCGIAQVAQERHIPLIDLDALKPDLVKIPNGKIIHQLKVCKEVLNADYIISVPVMKTHMHTQVSLSLKNMKGCLYKREKVKLHQLSFPHKNSRPYKPLDLAIADMSKILLPDLTVIDGTIGQEGLGPSAGQPIQAGIVLASANCLAADWVAAELMGFNPEQIHHLRLAKNELKEKNENYNINKGNIPVFPEDYLKWKVSFKESPKKISFEFANVIVDDKDSCSACLSTVLMFLKRYYPEFADYLSPEKQLYIALGKKIEQQPKNTLLIGNCTFKQKKGNVFIQGCPPVASQIKKEMDKLLKQRE